MRHVHVKDVLHLPFLDRLTHKKTRRHMFAVSFGIAVSLGGSYLACNHYHGCNIVVWDMLAYSIHGIGLIPICKHVEPLWMIILGE